MAEAEAVNTQGGYSRPGRALDPFDGRQPGRGAVVVKAGLDPVRLESGDVPPGAGVERRSQLLLTDRVRARVGTLVAEAQDMQGPVVLGHRRQAGHISWSFLTVEGVEQPAVQHRREPAPQPLQPQRVSNGELGLDPT